MPVLKKSKESEFLYCIAENVKLCSKVLGAKKTAAIMGVHRNTMDNKIKNPRRIGMIDIYRLSEYLSLEIGDFYSPLPLNLTK